jgi:hypothetical protein
VVLNSEKSGTSRTLVFNILGFRNSSLDGARGGGARGGGARAGALARERPTLELGTLCPAPIGAGLCWFATFEATRLPIWTTTGAHSPAVGAGGRRTAGATNCVMCVNRASAVVVVTSYFKAMQCQIVLYAHDAPAKEAPAVCLPADRTTQPVGTN